MIDSVRNLLDEGGASGSRWRARLAVAALVLAAALTPLAGSGRAAVDCSTVPSELDCVTAADDSDGAAITPPSIIPDLPTVIPPDLPPILPDPPPSTSTPVPPPPDTSTPVPPPSTSTPVPPPPPATATPVPPPPTSTPVPPPPPSTSTRTPPIATRIPPTRTSIPAPATETPVRIPPVRTPTADDPANPTVATRTPTSRASATPSGTVTASRTSTASPAATGTRTATSTSTPRATPRPLIAIAPPLLAKSADPGGTVRFTHTVTNGSPNAGTVNIEVRSSEDWVIRVFGPDGATALRDTDDDGVRDVGRLGSGRSAEIVVEVDVPPVAPGGSLDVTTVTASIPGVAKTATARDRTTVNGKLILTLDTAAAQPDAVETGPGGDPIAGTAPTGAGEIPAPSTAMVTVGVTSTGPWAGGCLANGAATGGGASAEPLGWRVDGVDGWTAFTAELDPGCFSVQEVGTLTYAYQYAPVSDGPSGDEASSVVTYRVVGDGG